MSGFGIIVVFHQVILSCHGRVIEGEVEPVFNGLVWFVVDSATGYSGRADQFRRRGGRRIECDAQVQSIRDTSAKDHVEEGGFKQHHAVRQERQEACL